MAWTLNQLNALKASIAQGALTVEYGDKKVTYRSLSEMIQIKNMMEQELGITNGTLRISNPVFNKGLGPKPTNFDTE